MAKILVTGCAGLLGSHLVDHLLAYGHTVWGIDNLSTGSEENVNEKLGRNFFQADLRRRDTLRLVMKIAKPEIVFHLAAWAHEGLSQFCPTLITENNYNASMNVLVESIRVGVKRFVFTSSMAVYGDQKPPFNEAMDRHPVDIYGISKASFENALEVMSKVHDFEYSIVRPHNVIGTRQAMHDPYRNVVAIFMNRLLAGLPFYIYGDGEQKRAFSFVNDFIPYLAKTGFVDAAKGEIFNMGADKEYSINELAKMILEISHKSIEPIYVPDRPQEVDNAWCNNNKAKHILGFEDKTPFREGLETMWKWAVSRGPQKPRYLPYLELVNEKTPKIWLEKKI